MVIFISKINICIFGEAIFIGSPVGHFCGNWQIILSIFMNVNFNIIIDLILNIRIIDYILIKSMGSGCLKPKQREEPIDYDLLSHIYAQSNKYVQNTSMFLDDDHNKLT